MGTKYAHALLQLLKEGMPIETALSGLTAALEKNRHAKLLPAVLLEVTRVLQAQKNQGVAWVQVAREDDVKKCADDIKAALATLGVSANTPVKTNVDQTLIGGFVATFDYKEHDQSYKKTLKSLYESVTK